MKDAEKIATFLVDQTQSPAFQRFHVRVESGSTVCASLMSLDKSVVYARVAVAQDLRTFQETGFEHSVTVQYAGQNGRATDLRHTWLSAARAACDLAEATERYVRASS